MAHNAHPVALFHGEIHVAQGPEFFVGQLIGVFFGTGKPAFYRVGDGVTNAAATLAPLVVNDVLLTDVFYRNDGHNEVGR